MRELAIEGIDGVGKTTVIGELKAALEDDGQTVVVAAPYHDVAKAHPDIDITTALHDPNSAQDVLYALALAIGQAQQQAYRTHADFLIYDRHWMTAMTERTNGGGGVWVAGKPQTALLDPDTGLSPQLYGRLVNPEESWAKDEAAVDDYANCYRQLAFGYQTCMLDVYRVDHLTTPEKIAKAIRWDLRIAR